MADELSPTEVGGTVQNSFGIRQVDSNITPIIGQAQTVANGVIDTVDGILSTLKDEGNQSLTSALEAIGALGAFKPTKVTVTYTPPSFNNISGFIIPTAFIGADDSFVPELPQTGNFDWTIDSKTPPKPTVNPAATSSIRLPAPPSNRLASASEPTAPKSGYVPAGQAPGLGATATLDLAPLALPTLKQFVMPVLKTITLPVIDFKPSGTMPAIPGITVTTNVNKAYAPTFTIIEHPVLIVEDASLIGPAITPREIRESTQVLESRGLYVDVDVLASQTEYATERAALMNAAERRKFSIDEILRNAELSRAYLTMLSTLDSVVAEASLHLAKIAFEGELLQAQARIELVQAAVHLYNGRVTAYNTAVALYKVMLQGKAIALQKWKAEVEGEIAKTRANAQLGHIYETQARALTAQAEVYDGQVQGLMAQIEGFKAQTQSSALAAEVARAQLDIYAGKIDAYQARVAAYKATFAAYSAQTRGTVAANQLESTKTQVSASKMTADGAGIQLAVIRMDAEAARLKAQALKSSTEHDAVRLKNATESIRATIDADVGKQKILEWSANQQIADVKSDAIVENARMAQHYYSAASDAAYRASEQTLRAILASTQASAIAHEAASKTAASVAQGAYSAVHVSASLSGSGRISGDEDHSARSSLYISDMLNYTESRESTLAG